MPDYLLNKGGVEYDLSKEKLLSMGQLLADVAHEINTPIGAINASVSSLQESYWTNLEAIPKSLGVLDLELTALLFDLIKEVSSRKVLLSTREIRAKRKELSQELVQYSENYARHWADQLVDLGYTESMSRYERLLKHANSHELMETVFSIVRQSKSIDNILLAISKIKNVTGAIGLYSRKEHDEVSRVIDLRDNMETILTLYQNKLKQIDVYKYYDPKPVLFECNPGELMQVWTNLIHNSIHAMREQGALTVRVEHKDEQILIMIKDNGPGIPEEIQSRVFDPYFTTKPQGEGTGLGLDIIKKIVDKHDGRIGFRSSTSGTSFIVQFPNQKPK